MLRVAFGKPKQDSIDEVAQFQASRERPGQQLCNSTGQNTTRRYMDPILVHGGDLQPRGNAGFVKREPFAANIVAPFRDIGTKPSSLAHYVYTRQNHIQRTQLIQVPHFFKRRTKIL
jgi:hypothetical protein